MNTPTLNEIAGYKEPAHLISVINDIEEKLKVTENLLSFFKKESNKNEELTRLRAEMERELATANKAWKLSSLSNESCLRELYRVRDELATERARLDSGTILLTVAGERVWHCGVDLRAAIDAAMKEDAKVATGSASDWARGYFCAVAKMIELEGQVQPDAAELFRCGGDARKADPEDQEIFREHGLLPNIGGLPRAGNAAKPTRSRCRRHMTSGGPSRAR